MGIKSLHSHDQKMIFQHFRIFQHYKINLPHAVSSCSILISSLKNQNIPTELVQQSPKKRPIELKASHDKKTKTAPGRHLETDPDSIEKCSPKHPTIKSQGFWTPKLLDSIKFIPTGISYVIVLYLWDSATVSDGDNSALVSDGDGRWKGKKMTTQKYIKCL